MEATQQEATENLAVVIERLKNFQEENKTQFCTLYEQVKHTNGSVAEIQKWRYLITGALIIMNLFAVPIIVAIVIKFVANNMF